MSEDRLRVDVVHLRAGRWRRAVHASDIVCVAHWEGGVDNDGDPSDEVIVMVRGHDGPISVDNTAEEIEGWMRDS
jgi:hypothetical protein